MEGKRELIQKRLASGIKATPIAGQHTQNAKKKKKPKGKEGGRGKGKKGGKERKKKNTVSMFA